MAPAWRSPEESITPAKQARLVDLAEAYVQAEGWPGPWRIDVVAIEMDRRGRLLRIDHYENAVSGDCFVGHIYLKSNIYLHRHHTFLAGTEAHKVENKVIFRNSKKTVESAKAVIGATGFGHQLGK